MHPQNKILHVTKLDAAERQFKTAVRLFFSGGDPIAIHTLGAAALQVLSDLLLQAGAGGISRNPHLFKESGFKKWINATKRYENFFKHAEKDAAVTLEFQTIPSLLQLWEAGLLLEVASQRVCLEARLLGLWVMKAVPEVFRLSESQREKLTTMDIEDLEMWSQALDDPTGVLAKSAKDWLPPPSPKTPYDVYLGLDGESNANR
jgi:hypothetical protein